MDDRGGGVYRLCRDVGGVLLAWTFMSVLEFVVIARVYRALFAGNWELIVGRKLVIPIAIAMLVPAALVCVALGRLAGRAADAVKARLVLAVAGGAFGGGVAFLVSTGRHFAKPVVRASFVALVFAIGFAAVFGAARPAVALLRGTGGRAAALSLGIVGASTAWLVDAHVLPRLYAGFHGGVFVIMLASSALLSLVFRSADLTRSDALVPLSGLVIAGVSLAWAPFAARRLSAADNLRVVLQEHAPILGRAVEAAALLSPPLPLEGPTEMIAAVGEVPRTLDWAGSDVLLVSVDALRADHVSAYGYKRPTTPNLDALAREGALFDSAYCPTPHTSYSVTSMMTGKAMRPLLSQGLGADSDTWATYLRRYGYRTAAFYPPAVFYIDEDRFRRFESSGLGFEYKWVEFTSADDKVKKVGAYLETEATGAPLFMWVHLFEPHEPYVLHPSHRLGQDDSSPVDTYDSEVAYVDAAIGDLVKMVRARRSRVAIIVTADHGEEFGEHGGRYHGTTCYEEQVRVPLLVIGPGVSPRRVPTVVSTIDLLPTVLSAIGIPRPARVRGRDLGSVLAARPGAALDPGLAYAETDEQTLVAQGHDRLVCARRLGACRLYDVSTDPVEQRDLGASEPQRARDLHRLMASIEREQGRYEAAPVPWPEGLRRGLQGEVDAARDVASLLDDANVVIRRKAAEVTFKLAATAVLPEARRTLARDEDSEARRWAALAVLRMGDPASDVALSLLRDPDPSWRRASAWAFAIRGDGRGARELADWWADQGPPRAGLDVAQAKELLLALATIRDTDAVPALLRSLDYVPLRAEVAATLGQIGDPRARAPLLGLLQAERYETARPFEARALVALGARREVLAPLEVYAGLPDPMTEAIGIAHDARLLEARRGGAVVEPQSEEVTLRLVVPLETPLRLWVLTGGGGEVTGDAAGETTLFQSPSTAARFADLSPRPAAAKGPMEIRLRANAGIAAAWVVPRLASLPPGLKSAPADAGTAPP